MVLCKAVKHIEIQGSILAEGLGSGWTLKLIMAVRPELTRPGHIYPYMKTLVGKNIIYGITTAIWILHCGSHS